MAQNRIHEKYIFEVNPLYYASLYQQVEPWGVEKFDPNKRGQELINNN